MRLFMVLFLLFAIIGMSGCVRDGRAARRSACQCWLVDVQTKWCECGDPQIWRRPVVGCMLVAGRVSCAELD